MNNPNIAKKIFFRISPQSFELLYRFKEKHGLKSMYELSQYIMACFIRYLKAKEGIQEPEEENQYLDEEVADMFDEYALSEKHFEYVKPKGKISPTFDYSILTKEEKLINYAIKPLIDDFITRNYTQLYNKYKSGANRTDSSGASSIDKLDKTLYNAYTNMDIHFRNQADCDAYMNEKFMAKEFRSLLKQKENDKKQLELF